VLVVDDDDDSRELLAATLQSHGALVLAALRAGFQMHLAKPMDSRSLVEAITSLVNGKEEPEAWI
jgi:CheY-like chemotaxis protein